MAILDNIVSYWKMDDVSGNALDSYGSNNLTDTNTVGTGTGIIHSARDFEQGSSEYFTIASNSTLQTGDIDFTWSAWVKMESNGDNMTILAKSDAFSDAREYFLGYVQSANRFQFFVSQDGTGFGGSVSADTFGAPSTGVWYHIVAWHDATNNQLGIAVNAGTADTASYSSGVNSDTSAFQIGSREDDLTPKWDGLIDEVGFWKRVLTSDERTSLYNAGAGLTYAFQGDPTVVGVPTNAYNSGFGASIASAAKSHVAGNLLVALVVWSEDPGFPSDITGVTNTAGDTFTAAGSRIAGFSNGYMQIWYTASSGGHASDVVTVAFDGTFGAQNRGLSIYEINGADTSSPLDDYEGDTGFDNPADTGSLTVSSTDIIVAIGQFVISTPSAGTGYNLTVFSGDSTVAHEFKSGVTASESATMNNAGGTFWKIVAAAFKIPSAGSSIKTIEGLAIASVKTVEGLAIANVKTVEGLTNV